MNLEIEVRRSIKKFLEIKGISLSKLSKNTGVSKGMLSEWMNGKKDLGFSKVCRIIEYSKYDLVAQVLHRMHVNHNWETIRQKIAVAQGRSPRDPILQEFFIENEGTYQLDLNETHRINYQTVGIPKVVGTHVDLTGMQQTTIDPYLVEWIAGSTNLSEHTLENAYEDDWTLQFFEEK